MMPQELKKVKKRKANFSSSLKSNASIKKNKEEEEDEGDKEEEKDGEIEKNNEENEDEDNPENWGEPPKASEDSDDIPPSFEDFYHTSGKTVIRLWQKPTYLYKYCS